MKTEEISTESLGFEPSEFNKSLQINFLTLKGYDISYNSKFLQSTFNPQHGTAEKINNSFSIFPYFPFSLFIPSVALLKVHQKHQITLYVH